MTPQLDGDKVISLFSLFSDLSGDDLEHWRGICEQNAADLAACVRPDVNLSAHMEALCTAAAGFAFSDYMMIKSGSGMGDEVRVGDIALKSTSSDSGDRESAAELRGYFRARVANLLVPDCPALIAVGDRP